MKIFWVVMLILGVANLGGDVFLDKGIAPVISDLLCIGVSIYWIERHHKRRDR